MTNEYPNQENEIRTKKISCQPLVSIGMPVYNGELTLKNAIGTIINQTYSNFELIISDNASTDLTEQICKEFSKNDKKIIYFRQTSNIGAASNFRFVLEQAQGDFFAWAACDDIRSDNFVEKNLHFLLENPDYVASTSPVRFEGEDYDEYRMGDKSLAGDVNERLVNFFKGWHANGRFYSLIRKKHLLNCTEIKKFYLGSDWAIILYLLSQGKFNRLNTGWIVLGKHGVSRSKNIFKITRSKTIEYIIPFFQLSIYVYKLIKLQKLSTNSILSITYSLFLINTLAIKSIIKFLIKK